MGTEYAGACHGIGEFVVYRGGGVYRIDDIRDESFCGLGKRKYYVISSVFDQSSVVYVPVDAKDIDKTLRRALTPSEIDGVIDEAGAGSLDWVEEVKGRAEYFDRLLVEGQCSDILRIFLTLRRHKEGLEGGRKRLYASDARILTAVEKIITDEFSFVLGIPRGDVLEYIGGRLLPPGRQG